MEFRSAPLEVRGRGISGLALPWGARARVSVRGEVMQETFVRDSFSNLKPVPLVREHRGPVIGEVTPQSTARGLEVRGEYDGDLGGRDRFSIEFQAAAETRSGELRIVHDATLEGLAAVRRPAYDSAVIEERQRGSVSAFVPTGRSMDCRCPDGCDEIEFAPGAFQGVADRVLATAGTMDKTLGTAEVAPGRDGLGIDLDLLDVQAAHDLVTLIVAGVAVYARPLVDLEESETEEGRNRGGTVMVRRASFGAILFKPVAGGVRGLDPVRLSQEREARSGLVTVEPSTSLEAPRRRIWL